MSKNIENILAKLSKIFLFLVPAAFLFTFSDLIFPYVVSKHLLFRVLVTLAFAFYIPLLFKSSAYGLRLGYLALLTIAFYLSFLIADLYAVYPGLAFWGNAERMEGFVSFIYLVLYFILLLLHLKNKEDWKLFLRTYMFFSSMLILGAFFQWLKIDASNFRLNTFLNNPIYLAGFANFHIAFAMLLARLSEYKAEKVAALATVPIAFLVMLATGTRGAVLAFAFALVAAFLLYVIKSKNATLKRLATASFFVVLLIFSSLLVFKESDLVRQIPGIQRFENLSLQEGTLFSRFVLWQIAGRAIVDRPYGWGQEGFNYVFNAYYDPRLWNHEEWFDRVHNTPLDILIQGGVLSFLIYLSLLAYIFYILYFKVKDPKEAFVLSFAFVSYFILSLSIFENLSSYIPLLIIIAYLAVFYDGKSAGFKIVLSDDNKSKLIKALPYVLALIFATASFQQIYLMYKSSVALSKIYALEQYKKILQISPISSYYQDSKIKSLKRDAVDIFTQIDQILIDASLSPGALKEYMIAMTKYSTLKAIIENKLVSDQNKKFYLGRSGDLIQTQMQQEYPNFMLLKYGAMWLESTGERKLSEDILLTLIHKAPSKVQFYENLAMLYLSRGEYEKALSVINKALHISKHNTRAQKIKEQIGSKIQESQ